MADAPRPRSIRKVMKSIPTMEGAGVRLRRAFGFNDVPSLDPFLLLDAFKSEDPEDYRAGFPWHPHRGIETITYVLDGNVEHGDSMGNRGLIAPGDVQWMTAGSGIIHQEMPQGDAKGRLWGFQLWANIPASRKMMDPRYREVTAAEIPIVRTDSGATVRVVAGEVNGVVGPVREIVTEPELIDVTLPPHARFEHPVSSDHSAFAYVIEGEGLFDSSRDAFEHETSAGRWSDLDPRCACGADTLVVYGPGDVLSVTAESSPVRFLLASGRPLNEPVAWYGPIVMNTQAELRAAFREFQDGTFVKHARR